MPPDTDREFARDLADWGRRNGFSPEEIEHLNRAMEDNIRRALEDVAMENWDFVRQFGIEPPTLFTSGHQRAPD